MSDRAGSPGTDRAAESLRLFVAVELSEAWREHATGVAEELRGDDGRAYHWVRPELYHVTLVFLGDQPAESLGAIEAALRDAADGVPPFELTLGALSAFGIDVPKALVLTVEDRSGALRELRRRLDAELDRRGVSFDRKGLRPHVTLGRARHRRSQGPGSGATDTGSTRLSGVVGPLQVREIALVKSELLPGGEPTTRAGDARAGFSPVWPRTSPP